MSCAYEPKGRSPGRRACLGSDAGSPGVQVSGSGSLALAFEFQRELGTELGPEAASEPDRGLDLNFAD